LTFDEENIEMVAAITKQLADYRFGSNGTPRLADHASLSKWTVTDAVAIWHGYRYGVPGVSPGGSGFEVIDIFQNRRNSILQPNVFIGPGGPVASARGSISSFVYYFPQ
jgi:hypothetical protein